MALTDSFPGPSGLTDSIEAGKDLAGLILHVGGSPKAGLFPGSVTPLVTARSDLRVDVAAFKAALVRAGGVRLTTNDTAAQSPDFTVPPANSRIDVLYVKVGEIDQGDAVDGPFFGILEGAAAPIPAKPALSIDGALELATVLIPSTATGTSSAGVVITQTAPVTAANSVPADTSGTVTPAMGAGWAAPNLLSLKRNNGWAQLNFNGARGASALAIGGVVAAIPAGYRTGSNVWGFAWGLGGATNPLPVYYDAATHQVKINTALGASQSIAVSLMWRVES